MSTDEARPDPHHLPEQREGTTPQRVGRYPDYDVLSQVGHWDDVTRRVVEDRVQNVPPIRFFTETEAHTLKAFCDVATAQDAEPRIPVPVFVGQAVKYPHSGENAKVRILAKESSI